MARARAAVVVAATACTTLLAACGGGDSTSPTPTPTPTISITAAPASLTLTQGQSGTSTITLTRGGSYAGAVGIAVTGAPNGVTATPASGSLTGTTATSAITVATTATAAPGTYTLAVAASGTGVTTANASITLVVNAAAPTTNTLTVATAGTGAGKVTSAPAGIDCGAGATTCSAPFAAGASVTLTAAPNAGSAFGGWSGACTGTAATCTVAMGQAQNVTATFSQVVSTVALTVATAGAGTGTVTSSPAGITCPGTCTTNVAAGTVVTLTAAPTNGSTFTSWSAPCAASTATTCAVTVNAAQTVTATFAAAPAGSYTLAVAPASLTVTQGTSGTATVNVARTNGFAGAVTLAVAGAPNGLTVTPNPTSVAGATSTLTVAATTAVAPGTYPIAITGTATGIAAQTTTLSVQVTAAPSGGGNVTYSFAGCDPIDVPVWLAYQDGTGAWTRVTPNASNVYTFGVGARGGVAYVTRNGSAYDLTVLYAAASELAATTASRCGTDAPMGTKHLTGTVAGASATDFVTVSLGAASASVIALQSSAFSLDSVADGPRDLVASRATFGGSALVPNKLIVRRNVNYANGSAIPTLDFGGSEAFDPVQRTITVNGLNGDEAFASVSFLTANGASAAFYAGAASAGGQVPYYALPTSQLAAGDLHQVVVGASPTTQNPTTSRLAFAYFRAATDRAITLGPSLAAAGVTSLGTAPYLRLGATLPSQAAYNGLASATFAQATRSATVMATASYAGGAPATWSLQVPDLTAAGFDATWGLRTGVAVNWTVTAVGGDILAFAGITPTDGAQLQAATVSGSSSAFARFLRGRGVALRRAR
ncbi:MAG: hypothetical protein JO180_12345 [Gemmatirosa sp.]|nr:hypothetical protein [Gemmatirosa sp.]